MAIVISGVNNNDKITASDGTIDLLSGVNYAGIITAPAFTTPGNLTAGHLNIGSGIQLGNAGVATATTFVGNLTGNVNNTGNLLLQISGSEKFRVASSGQLGIGGANYGSAGQVLTSGGSGSAATWSTVSGTTINDNAANRIITGEGGTTLNGEANLNFDGTGLGLVGHIDIRTGSSINTNVTGGYASGTLHKNTNSGEFAIVSGGTGGNNHLTFYTSASAAPTEKLRITSSGQLLISESSTDTTLNNWTGATINIKNTSNTDNNKSVIYFSNSAGGTDAAIQAIHEDADGTGTARRGFLSFGTSGSNSSGSVVERARITGDGRVLIGTNSGTGVLCVNTGSGTGDANTVQIRRPSSSDYSALMFTTGATVDWSIGQNSAGDFEIFEDGADSTTRLSVHTGGTVQVQNHLTSRNGIVQINQVTSQTRYSGSAASVDLITGSTFTPKTSAPRFLIMIFCPVNTSDDSDAGSGNRNDYFYGRIEYRKSGGGWTECNDQGSTAQQGGYAAHISLSPNRTGNQTSDYWGGNRYRMEHKQATILVTNVGDCGDGGTVQFKLRSYSYGGSFLSIGQPHGYGSDDDYGVQPWGFTVFELAPDSNSYTAY